MAGTSKPVSILVTKTGDGEFRGSQRRGFEAVFTIDRSEFGMIQIFVVIKGPV